MLLAACVLALVAAASASQYQNAPNPLQSLPGSKGALNAPLGGGLNQSMAQLGGGTGQLPGATSFNALGGMSGQQGTDPLQGASDPAQLGSQSPDSKVSSLLLSGTTPMEILNAAHNRINVSFQPNQPVIWQNRHNEWYVCLFAGDDLSAVPNEPGEFAGVIRLKHCQRYKNESDVLTYVTFGNTPSKPAGLR